MATSRTPSQRPVVLHATFWLPLTLIGLIAIACRNLMTLATRA